MDGTKLMQWQLPDNEKNNRLKYYAEMDHSFGFAYQRKQYRI
jgi:hypothetical protein